ncbi:prenyltransferase [Amycolatopsis japonica]
MSVADTREARAAADVGVVRAMLRLGRVKFLLQSTCVVGAGAGAAVGFAGGFDVDAYLLVLLFAWLTHLMTHYCNEYFDLEADRANAAPTAWTGGSRVLVSGLLPPQVSLSAAFVLLFCAIGVSTLMPSTGQRLIAATIIALAWFYTAPPLRLNYHAVGEIACAAVLYTLGPLLAYLGQSNALSAAFGVYLGMAFALQLLRCLIMNLPDIPADRKVGKTTLAGLLGHRGVTIAYGGGHTIVYLGVAVATGLGIMPRWTGGLLLATVPIPVWVTSRLARHRPIDAGTAELVTFWSSVLMPISSCAVIVGMTLSATTGPPTLWLIVASLTVVVFAGWLVRTITMTLARHPSPDLPEAATS